MNQLVENWVLEAVRKQPFYKRYANTIVAAIGALAAVLSFVATLPIDERWAGALPAAISVLTMLGIKLTKNGIAPSAASKLRDAADTAQIGSVGLTDSTVYTGSSSVPSVTPNPSGLPVYQQGSSAVESETDSRIQDNVEQTHGFADSVHDQGVQLAADTSEQTGRHRGE